MSAGINTDKGCEDMDCCRRIGMKAVGDESLCPHSCDKSSFEIMGHNDETMSSVSEVKTDHLSKSSDINDDYAVHGDDQDMPSSSLESCPSETEDSSPIQCTEDMPQKGIEEKRSRADSESCPLSQVKVFVDDVDLPHDTSETGLSENNGHHDKAPRLLYVADLRKEKLVNKEELRLKYSTEKDTSRKLAVSNQVESTEASPLDIMPFLKPLPRQRQVVCVNMIHGSTQVSSPIRNKLPDNVASIPDQYRYEMNRLATYLNYPSDLKVYAITLAGNGFIYLYDEQSVECCFCKLRIDLSELNTPGADPKRMHFSKSSLCPLKQGGKNCGNVPVKVPGVDENGTASDKPDHVSSSRMKLDSVITTTRGSIVGREERPAGSVYRGDEASERPSPVDNRFRAVDIVTDSVPLPVQEPPSPPRRNANTNGDVQRLPVDLSSSATVTDSVPLFQHPEGAAALSPVNANRPNTAESRNKNKAGSSSSGSEQNGASASASANPSRASKSSKKSKAAKKAEAAASRKTPASSGGAGSASSSASAPNSSGNKSNGSSSSDKGEQGKEKKKLTYADLGIFADKPKRPDMASLQKRIGTFEEKWKSTYAKTKEELGECGMYYAGYADCARCFFCGGGLKNWEAQDEPWVEHARWFPKCAYLLLCKGHMFVDIIQRKNRNNDKIIMKDVEEEIKQKNQRTEAPAVSLPVSSSDAGQGSQMRTLRALEAENEELNNQVTCKICMDERSSMVFLPCGHMVACTDCAVVLKTCPLCRSEIRGTVKAHMDI